MNPPFDRPEAPVDRLTEEFDFQAPKLEMFRAYVSIFRVDFGIHNCNTFGKLERFREHGELYFSEINLLGS